MKHLIDALMDIKGCTIYGNLEEENIGIISFNIDGVDPYLLCSYMSNLDGIQSRAGCSCAGPYGHDLLGLKDNSNFAKKPGWLRLSIHYAQEINDIDYLLGALKKSIIEIKKIKSD